MIFTITIDGVTHTNESDRDIQYVIIGRIAEADIGSPRAGAINTRRQALGWCATREEAEVGLQTLFSKKLFSDLEIIHVAVP